jgi:hypothetical protein
MSKFTYIKELFNEPHRGGDLDFIVLKDDSVLIISDEYIGHYKSFDSWVDGDNSINGFELRINQNEAN